MNRKELYAEINDVNHDFLILKKRVESYFEEEKETILKLDKVNNKFTILDDEKSGNYGTYIVNDILQDITFIESELNFLIFNKDCRLRAEILEHLESLEEKLKVTSNKFKQLNMDIKDAFYSQVIRERTLK